MTYLIIKKNIYIHIYLIYRLSGVIQGSLLWYLIVFDFVKGVYNLEPLTWNQINIFLMFCDFLFFLNYFAQTSHCNANIATNYFGSQWKISRFQTSFRISKTFIRIVQALNISIGQIKVIITSPLHKKGSLGLKLSIKHASFRCF